MRIYSWGEVQGLLARLRLLEEENTRLRELVTKQQ
jgi:hypothetical protein